MQTIHCPAGGDHCYSCVEDYNNKKKKKKACLTKFYASLVLAFFFLLVYRSCLVEFLVLVYLCSFTFHTPVMHLV